MMLKAAAYDGTYLAGLILVVILVFFLSLFERNDGGNDDEW